MPTINLTNNTDVILTASSADGNATLNRYLLSELKFKTPPGFEPVSSILVKDQDQRAFPMVFSPTGEGKFAVEKTTLDLQLGASASAGLLKGDEQADFLSGLKLTSDASSPGLVSFGVKGTLAAGDSAIAGDFTFGITKGASFALTSYYAAAPGDKLLDAVKTAIQGLTVPHDITDLGSLPAGAICRLDANSSLKFSASFAYNFLNDPLATVSLGKLPSFAINATASATIEGAATHTSGHTLTIAKLPSGRIHLSVCLTKIDDLETSLTVSAGATGKIGGQDTLAFLLDIINPGSTKEADAIAAAMPNAAKFRCDMKLAIDTALCSALAVSLKAALESKTARNRVFVYEIDIDGLDDISRPALQLALKGDFIALTRTGAQLNGIQQLDSALTVTATHTHTLALHFLGIFNAASVNTFITKSKINFTSDTHEIVLSDESVDVVTNNLDAEKLRKLVLKDITLTLPASANTKDAATPITIAYIEREASTGREKMRQFVNVLSYLRSPKAVAAQALLGGNKDRFGACVLSLALALDPPHCRKLFSGPNGAYDWKVYIEAFCKAEKVILAGDSDSPWRSLLFNANESAWNELHEAGSAQNIEGNLQKLGMSQTQAKLTTADVITAVWWADAMAAYAKALEKGQSLEAAGKQVLKDSNNGFHEPWMVLAAWDLTGQPAITAEFAGAFPETAAAAGR